jgi:hypothetical protein
MGGCGRWLGLAIGLDAEAVMLNARHIFLRLLPLVYLFGCVHLLGSPLSFPLQPACYVGHGVSFWAAFSGSALLIGRWCHHFHHC